MKVINFFLCLWVIFALLDPDTDPGTPLNPDPNRIQRDSTRVDDVTSCVQAGRYELGILYCGRGWARQRTDRTCSRVVRRPREPSSQGTDKQCVADSELGSGIRCLFWNLDPEIGFFPGLGKSTIIFCVLAKKIVFTCSKKNFFIILSLWYLWIEKMVEQKKILPLLFWCCCWIRDQGSEIRDG